MSDKQHILDSIAAIAKRLGRTPSFMEFVAHAEISKYSLLRFFPPLPVIPRAVFACLPQAGPRNLLFPGLLQM
jgi:hypothetical protein